MKDLIDQYVIDLETLLHEAFGMHELDKTIYFKNGLKDSVREYINLERQDTLKETILRAPQASEYSRKPHSDALFSLSKYNNKKKHHHGKSHNSTNSATGNNTAYKPKKQVFCNYCGISGHIAPECRKKKRETATSSTSNNNGYKKPICSISTHQSKASNFEQQSIAAQASRFWLHMRTSDSLAQKQDPASFRPS